MPWIPITSRASFQTTLALKLYPPESAHLCLSTGAHEAMGSPERITVFFDPERRAIALQGTEHGGYKVHMSDPHGKGMNKRVQINAARALRRLASAHGIAWPTQVTDLSLAIEGPYMVAVLPPKV